MIKNFYWIQKVYKTVINLKKKFIRVLQFFHNISWSVIFFVKTFD